VLKVDFYFFFDRIETRVANRKVPKSVGFIAIAVL